MFFLPLFHSIGKFLFNLLYIKSQFLLLFCEKYLIVYNFRFHKKARNFFFDSCMALTVFIETRCIVTISLELETFIINTFFSIAVIQNL